MVLAMMMLVVSIGCSNKSQSSSSSSSSQGQFELKVGFDPEHPPFSYINDSDEYEGFDLDFAKAVCELKGWKFKPVEIDWSAKESALKSGSINCVWSAFTMEGREKNYALSDPYYLNKQVIVVKDQSNINSLSEIEGKVVITQDFSVAFDILTEGERASLGKTFASFPTVADYSKAFQQLDLDYVDAVACDSEIADYYISEYHSQYRILSEPLREEHFAVGFAKGNTDLADEINSAFQQLKENGFIDKLCQEYSEDGISRNECLI